MRLPPEMIRNIGWFGPHDMHMRHVVRELIEYSYHLGNGKPLVVALQ